MVWKADSHSNKSQKFRRTLKFSSCMSLHLYFSSLFLIPLFLHAGQLKGESDREKKNERKTWINPTSTDKRLYVPTPAVQFVFAVYHLSVFDQCAASIMSSIEPHRGLLSSSSLDPQWSLNCSAVLLKKSPRWKTWHCPGKGARHRAWKSVLFHTNPLILPSV